MNYRDNGITKEEHEAYLKTPEWRQLKSAVWRRADGCCERCERKKEPGIRYDVHHLTYERFGDEWLIDLQLLCEDCHRFVHDISEYDPLRPPTFEELEMTIREFQPSPKDFVPTPSIDDELNRLLAEF